MSLTAEQIRARYAPTMTSPVPLTDPGSRSIPTVTIEQVCRPVTEQVTVHPLTRTARTGMYLDRADRAEADDLDLPTATAPTADLALDDAAFGPAEVLTYVAREIESRFGPFPRSPHKEKAIFARFCAHYGEWALPIARHAFQAKGGYWKGAPVSMTRFCKGSDPYFGDLILAHLHNIAMQPRNQT